MATFSHLYPIPRLWTSAPPRSVYGGDGEADHRRARTPTLGRALPGRDGRCCAPAVSRDPGRIGGTTATLRPCRTAANRACPRRLGERPTAGSRGWADGQPLSSLAEAGSGPTTSVGDRGLARSWAAQARRSGHRRSRWKPPTWGHNWMAAHGP